MIINKYKINLKGKTKNVKEFVELSNLIAQTMDLEIDRHCVDAKSLLGVISLDTSKDMILIIYGDCYCEALNKILENFEVKE